MTKKMQIQDGTYYRKGWEILVSDGMVYHAMRDFDSEAEAKKYCFCWWYDWGVERWRGTCHPVSPITFTDFCRKIYRGTVMELF